MTTPKNSAYHNDKHNSNNIGSSSSSSQRPLYQRLILKENTSILFKIPIRFIDVSNNENNCITSKSVFDSEGNESETNSFILFKDVQRLYPQVTTLFLDGYPLPTELNQETGQEIDPIRFKAYPDRVLEAYSPVKSENYTSSSSSIPGTNLTVEQQFSHTLLREITQLTHQLSILTHHVTKYMTEDSFSGSPILHPLIPSLPSHSKEGLELLRGREPTGQQSLLQQSLQQQQQQHSQQRGHLDSISSPSDFSAFPPPPPSLSDDDKHHPSITVQGIGSSHHHSIHSSSSNQQNNELEAPPPNYELPPVYDAIVIHNTNKLREGLFSFERNIHSNQKVDSFLNSRESWLHRCNTAALLTDFSAILILLQRSLDKTCFNQEWFHGQRQDWGNQVKVARNLEELKSLLVELEDHVYLHHPETMTDEWKEYRQEWKNKLS